MMKIEFAPLNVPLRRRLQTAAVVQWVFSFLVLAQCCLAMFILLSLSRWWILAALYAGWLYLDRDTPSCGGRRSHWVRSWTVWKYFSDYFPITLIKTVDLDPKHNYLFGFHPHGVLVAGGFGNFCTEASGFSALFPGLMPYLLMLPFWFRVPFFRDYIMCGDTRVCRLELKGVAGAGLHPTPPLQLMCYHPFPGLVSSEKASASYILSRPGGGHVAVVAVGGAPESLDARPGALTLQVLNRKGFIKMALKHGAHLVPVFSFGENELFDQMENPVGSLLRRLQERLQKVMGVALPLFHARGVFQYSFGLLPYRKPIHTVVGRPIAVTQTPSPSAEDIETLHKLYLEGLTQLFEENKAIYGIPQNKHLQFI
ncbi:2-acylglycerol O-acyltransferase 2-A isoform X1 [Scleropages formosus]|uniref:2-acylglycerol O-acyltransferase 2-A isoform X1 n=1 Tax=Scleropages formosus TaxID=113540 RepID=UPI0010FAA21A|nr:2-acylglycerol O-acyltransferase 2-A isoform X1 [Scleropages formosus]